MHQWISAVNSYYYPYMIYHVSHERNVFPELGIASDEKVVAHALPKIEVGLQVVERQLAHGKDYLLGSELSLADLYLLPSTYGFSFAPEAKAMYPKYPAFCRWRENDGSPASRQEAPHRPAAARTDRACAEMGRVTSTEILILKDHLCRAFRGGRSHDAHSSWSTDDAL